MFFRDLTANEIECRVQSVKHNGLVLLLYKNARCDMNILDEAVGPGNWQREHYECKGNLFCRVGLRIVEGVPASQQDGTLASALKTTRDEWVWKSDCGVESNTEAQKGEASDSFKRACFNWGIGRELYTAPFIFINACELKDTGRKDKNGKPIFVCYDKFEVEKIIIENKRIVALAIKNITQNCRAFVWQEPK